MTIKMTVTARDNQSILVGAFVALLRHSSANVQLFETHLSWVMVADDFAYKIKKAIHFDFVDCRTLEARHFYCKEELRLNRRLAPDLYLAVLPILGPPNDPQLDGFGTAIEYAVKMCAFAQPALWNYRIAHGLISAAEIDALAIQIARFHQNIDRAQRASAWGAPHMIAAAAQETLDEIAVYDRDAAAILQQWENKKQQRLHDVFELRKADGWIKECHGDLHSGNILTTDDIAPKVEVFDCIDFNASLRWIDVINDIAFVCMDLHYLQRPDLAARLLNQYLEIGGDYAGLAVFRYYQTHRALVRSKVAFLRAGQCLPDSPDAKDYAQRCRHYLDFALGLAQAKPGLIMITHGPAGSGKSTFSRLLVEALGAVQLRSDIERKRMRGLAPNSRAGKAPDSTLYDPETTQATYRRLMVLARQVGETGLPVIIDAVFATVQQRRQFQSLAKVLGLRFIIFDMRASETTMQARILARTRLNRDPSDADLTVLARQLAEHEALTDDEMQHVIPVESEDGITPALVQAICAQIAV
jgi:aminoglycoside phosphotransferase family enzyme/predicted kinase